MEKSFNMTTEIPKKLIEVFNEIKCHGPLATCEINYHFSIKTMHKKVSELYELGLIKEHSKDGRTVLWVAA